MEYTLGLLIDGAILGLLVIVMEGSEFPGWGPVIGTVLAIGVGSGLAAHLIPGPNWLIGAVAGTFVAAFFFNWLFNMEPRRSFIAAGVYLAVRTVLGLLLSLMMAA